MAWPGIAMKGIKWGTVALYIVTFGGLLYLFVPLVTITVFTFNDPTTKFNTTWEGFTWDNWLHPFKQKAFTDALIESLKVAFVACTVATVLGSLIALALVRYRMFGSTTINVLLVLPLTTPEIVMGASLFTLFFNQGVARGYWTIVIAHVMFCLSFVALTVKARLRGGDWTLEEAAMDLGATPLRVIWKVTLPLVAPGIAAAAMLSFALSLDDFIITLFNSGTRVTYPLYVYGAQRAAYPPQINVMATTILAISLLALVATSIWQRRVEAKGVD
jgi:spermidine/putrescine transport system permease protein